ncbi:MAG: 2-amino-4-hydroxy-6-hydroxymethyldihydropteridine diphosphokinase [Saprospiraceae bacterium]|nr:2-amino-4-hydroxy-6-hydroxymethyldihydropteridine diphosphokinase [Saprospiraceae bacterium]
MGSNLGDRKNNLVQAVESIEATIGPVQQKSHIYLTEAWGMNGQPDFYNQVVSLVTSESANALLAILQEIESNIGRKRIVKWEARIIDIDILFYGDLIVRTQTLRIPHPLIPKRNFALIPLLELVPDLVHPVLDKTIQELYIESLDPLEVLMLDTNG